MTEYELPVARMLRPRWGNPATPAELPGLARAALGGLGVRGPRPAVDAELIEVPEPTLPGAALAALRDAVGDAHVHLDRDTRLQHTRGYSTPDLLRLRAGDAADAPDAVVRPAGHDQTVAVLAACAAHRVAVVPFGGGTSVVGGLAPERAGFAGVVTLDLDRLDGLESVDSVSRIATLQAGVRGPRAELLLAEHGFTLGHFPQSYEGASIGGYAAARSSGQSSAGYGRFDDLVVGLRLATAHGTLRLGTAPKSAAGPDLRQLLLGSEGTFGVITAVTVVVRPVPQRRVFTGWRFADFDAGAAALRGLAQDGPMPTVLRLSDEVETAINLADPSGATGTSGGCLAVVGVEGAEAEVEARQARIDGALVAAGGQPLGDAPGQAWRHGRFLAPYLRDPLLDAGVLVETLETATFWSGLAALRSAVTEAVVSALTEPDAPVLVMCHLSHVYASGASLYFTVVCAQTDDPIGQWARAKAAASAAILSQGATITHHHGVGTDHRGPYADEIGPLGVAALRAVKAALDPEGILNPGVLVAPESR